MPQIDGLSTTKTIRELNSEASAVKIAGYSASAFDEDRQRCIDSGMDSFLSKPLTRDKLMEVFDELDL
jgi:CheY-like chemotaxis protein